MLSPKNKIMFYFSIIAKRLSNSQSEYGRIVEGRKAKRRHKAGVSLLSKRGLQITQQQR